MRALLALKWGFPGVSDRKGKFGVRLKQLREEAGLTVYALAKRAGLTQINVHRIEKGERDPAWPTAVKLAEALGVSLAAFDAVPPDDQDSGESGGRGPLTDSSPGDTE